MRSKLPGPDHPTKPSPARIPLLQSRHVDLDAKPHVGLGEITLGQATVQIRGDVACPGMVKRMPVTAQAQRGSEVVLKWHYISTPSSQNRLILDIMDVD